MQHIIYGHIFILFCLAPRISELRPLLNMSACSIMWYDAPLSIYQLFSLSLLVPLAKKAEKKALPAFLFPHFFSAFFPCFFAVFLDVAKTPTVVTLLAFILGLALLLGHECFTARTFLWIQLFTDHIVSSQFCVCGLNSHYKWLIFLGQTGQ